MEQEHTFWIIMWGFILVGFLAMVGGLTAYNTNLTNRMAELVQQGKNPIAVKCALDFNTNDLAMCVMVVQK